MKIVVPILNKGGGYYKNTIFAVRSTDREENGS